MSNQRGSLLRLPGLALAAGGVLAATQFGYGIASTATPAVAANASTACLSAPTLGPATTNKKLANGVAVRSWTNPGGKTRRVTVATGSLDSIDFQIRTNGFPGASTPAAYMTNAIVGVNADFFDMFDTGDSSPSGPIMQDGTLVYAPPGSNKMVGQELVIPDPTVGYATTGALASEQKTIALQGLNLAEVPQDSAVVYDSRWSGTSVPKGDATLVLSNGVVTQVYPTGISIAPTTSQTVIQARGTAAASLRNLSAKSGVNIVVPSTGTPVSYTSKGTATSGSHAVAIAGVNLPAIVRNAAVLYNTSWSGATPSGDATVVLAGNKVASVIPAGRSVAVPPGGRVLQLQGKSAAAARLWMRSANATVTAGSPITTIGLTAKTPGTLGADNLSIPIGSVNSSSLSTTSATAYTAAWTRKSPAGAATFVLEGNRVAAYYPQGASLQATPGTIVVQVPTSYKPQAARVPLHPVGSYELAVPPIHPGSLHMSMLSIKSSLTSGSTTLPISAINFHSLNSKGAVLYTKAWTKTKTPAGSVALVIKNGVLTARRTSATGIAVPSGAQLIQVPSTFAAAAKSIAIGAKVDVDIDYKTDNGARYITSVGRGAALMHQGNVVATCDEFSEVDRPRTALGWDDAGHIWMLTITSGQPDTWFGYRTGGGTVHQAAEFLKSLGAKDAVAFDGGGSTTMLRSDDSAPGATPIRLDLPQKAWQRPVPAFVVMSPR